MTGSLAGIPEQRYAEEAFANRPPRMLIEDLEALSLAVQSGLGVAVLPTAFAQQLGDVVEVFPEQIGVSITKPPPVRHFWMVVHQSKQHIPRVRAVIDWIEDCFSRPHLP
jgi:DNA-binding transcriptional LysR family regulator